MTADHPVRPWFVCNGNPCTCTKPGRAPDLSPAEAARVAEFDAALEPPEIVVERVARALWNYDLAPNDPAWDSEDAADQDYYRAMAAAAIAALDAS